MCGWTLLAWGSCQALPRSDYIDAENCRTADSCPLKLTRCYKLPYPNTCTRMHTHTPILRQPETLITFSIDHKSKKVMGGKRRERRVEEKRKERKKERRKKGRRKGGTLE